MSADRLERKRKEIQARIRAHRGALPALVRSLSESARGWKAYYQGELVRPQLEQLEEILVVETAAWLRDAQADGRTRGTLNDLRRELLQVELPVSSGQKEILRWANRVLARSRVPDSARPAPPAPSPSGPQSPAARAAIELRKRELARRRSEMEELLITQPGSSLHRNGERLVVRREGKRQAEIPLALIRGVTLLTTAASISAEFMAEAAARGVRLTIHGSDGRPMVRSGPPDLPDFAISELQTRLASGPQHYLLARSFVAGKIRNQINLLKYLNKHKTRRNAPETGAAVLQALETMEPLFRTAHAFAPHEGGPPPRQSLFAIEGQAASAYWNALRAFLPARAGFPGRVRQGATDLVNSLLNYGYAILYSRLQEILLKQGLNPGIGFLHVPREGKQALLYDFIEEFRPSAVDRVVISLLNLGKPYEVDQGGLPPEVRHELARHIVKRWRTAERYNGGKYTLEQIAAEQARRLIRHLRGEEPYRPYVLSW
jgi:CRISPR-associated protein Cas1